MAYELVINLDVSDKFKIKTIDKTKIYALKILLILSLKYFLFKNLSNKKIKNNTDIQITFWIRVKTIIL